MKKYSERFLNNHSVLKNCRLGLEFEFYSNLSYYKTLEMLNIYLAPIKVHGFNQYHSDFETDEKNFKLEPDLSLGVMGCELITGPMRYYDAKFYLVKILKFIQEYGYTNDKSSIHFNISFTEESDKNLNDLNALKLILTTDEDEIYRVYPSRKDNVYAKSIKKIIPYKEYDFNDVPIDIIKNNLRLPSDKYFGINFLHTTKDRDHQRLEFRYIGGKDYEKNVGQIIYFLDRFIIDTYNSIDSQFTDEDIKRFEEYMDKNISTLKTFSKYDNFIVEYPTVSIQIDQNSVFEVVNSYFDRLFSKLFHLVESTNDLKDCIINFVTSTQRIEVIDANIKANFNIKNIDFINCNLSDGIFEYCSVINSQTINSQLIKCDITGSDITKSKVLNCKVESSQLTDCFFMNGYLNGDLSGAGSIYRSGKMGPYATIGPEVKIVTDGENFFRTKFDEDDYDKGKDEGAIKGYKK